MKSVDYLLSRLINKFRSVPCYLDRKTVKTLVSVNLSIAVKLKKKKVSTPQVSTEKNYSAKTDGYKRYQVPTDSQVFSAIFVACSRTCIHGSIKEFLQ